jgi:inosose dehydratase
MATISVANAPCSWGALEFADLKGKSIGYEQMLDELCETGYAGTELGDWGYMPTEPASLRAALEQRQLVLLGSFVPVALKYVEAHVRGEAQALQVARLLAAATATQTHKPLLILADENGSDPLRTSHAGRITAEMGLSSGEWKTFIQGVQRIASIVRMETGLATAFHHHCAGYIETPQEITRFLEMTDPDLISLVFDTGHYLYGSGGIDGSLVLEGLDHVRSRVQHVHFKDCQPQVAQRARNEAWDYFKAIQHGVFCELGQGSVPFAAIAEHLHQRGQDGDTARSSYQGWIVVEQDVLPGMGDPKASAQRNRRYLQKIGL